MKEIVFATANKNKLRELREILTGYQILSLKDIGFQTEIEENGNSFEENALIKATNVFLSCGKTVIADDSGLCVDALGGAPGIYSARYSGCHGDDKANNIKLLREMREVAAERRTAKFVSAGAVVFDDGSEYVVRGEVNGLIGYEELGENGFGYDPLFVCKESGLTYAQMENRQKNEISHRKRAFEKLKPKIDRYFENKAELENR